MYPSVTGILQETCTPSGILGHIPLLFITSSINLPRKSLGHLKTQCFSQNGGYKDSGLYHLL